MPDSVKIDTSGLTKFGVKLKRYDALLKKIPLAGQLASNARVMIHERTRKGLNVNRTRFRAYSTDPYYRDAKERPKAKGGRRKRKDSNKKLSTVAYDGGYKQFKGATAGSTTVNLIASGEMFRGFKGRALSHNRAIVSFDNVKSSRKALILTARKGKFVGLNDAERKKLERHAAQIVRRTLNSSGIKT